MPNPVPPAFVTPAVFKVLRDKYDLKLTGASPVADLKASLTGVA